MLHYDLRQKPTATAYIQRQRSNGNSDVLSNLRFFLERDGDVQYSLVYVLEKLEHFLKKIETSLMLGIPKEAIQIWQISCFLLIDVLVKLKVYVCT